MDIQYELGLIHNRLYQLEKKENELGYKDMCIYMCVCYIGYVIFCKLT